MKKTSIQLLESGTITHIMAARKHVWVHRCTLIFKVFWVGYLEYPIFMFYCILYYIIWVNHLKSFEGVHEVLPLPPVCIYVWVWQLFKIVLRPFEIHSMSREKSSNCFILLLGVLQQLEIYFLISSEQLGFSHPNGWM